MTNELHIYTVPRAIGTTLEMAIKDVAAKYGFGAGDHIIEKVHSHAQAAYFNADIESAENAYLSTVDDFFRTYA